VRPLRILYDFEAFSDQDRGGVSRYIFEVANHLAETGGADVRIAAGWHRSRLLLENLRPWITGRYIPAMRWTGELRRRINAVATQRAIDEFKPDIVHRSYHRHAAEYTGTHRTVATIHDLTYFVYPESFPSGEIVRQRLKRVAETADHLFCDSANTRDDARRILGIADSRMTVVPLGVRIPSHSFGIRPARGNFFIFVGQRAGYKNFAALLQSVAATPTLSQTRILAFGGGPLTQAEQRLIASLNLQTRVVTASGDDAALAGNYSNAIALVYPSHYEGFGLPVLEAMAHGCPVACGRTSSLPEVGGDAALYFDPTDIGDISTTLVHLSADAGLRDRLSAAGRAWAAQFSWKTCAERALDVYDAVFARHRTKIR
jgi:glycosyltransferase involved in cell wall biosynthesis